MQEINIPFFTEKIIHMVSVKKVHAPVMFDASKTVYNYTFADGYIQLDNYMWL